MQTILIILTLLLLALPCQAQEMVSRLSVGTLGGGVAAVSCSSSVNTCSGNNDSGRGLNTTSTYKYVATKFIAAKTTTICGADLVLSKVGESDPTHSYAVSIWSNVCSTCDRTDDHPNAIIGNASTNTVTWNDLDVAYAAKAFTGISASITADGVYWVVIVTTGTADATNYGSWGLESTGCTTEQIEVDDNAVNWSNLTNANSAEYVLYE